MLTIRGNYDQRSQTRNRIIGPTKRKVGACYPPRQFLIQRKIQAFNERMAELEEGHRGRAMDVLKAKRVRFCSPDQRASLLFEPAPKAAPKRKSRNLSDR
jgi:hypothetical protein